MARPYIPASSRPDLAFQDDTALMAPGTARDRMLDQIKQSGGRFIRTNVIYNKWQDPNYRANLDSLVNAARSRGIGIQETLMGTPAYVPSARTDQVSAYHADPDQFGAWANEVSKHFQGRVRRYSIWNEPQASTFLADRSPKRYRALYQAGRKAVMANTHGGQVLLGELMPGASGNTDPAAKANAENFLRRIVAAGSKPLVSEGLALHPYAWGGERPDGTSRGPDTYSGINQLTHMQQLLKDMQRTGRFTTRTGGKVPLYLTEFGYQRKDVPNNHARMQRLRKAYELAGEAGAREMLYYQLKPSTPRPGGAWTWDTSIASGGRVPHLAVARAAKAKGRH